MENLEHIVFPHGQKFLYYCTNMQLCNSKVCKHQWLMNLVPADLF